MSFKLSVGLSNFIVEPCKNLWEPLAIASAGMVCFLFDASHENHLHKSEVPWRAVAQPAICLCNDSTLFQRSNRLLFNTCFVILGDKIIRYCNVLAYVWLLVDSAIVQEFALEGGKTTSLGRNFFGTGLTIFFSINVFVFKHRIFPPVIILQCIRQTGWLKLVRVGNDVNCSSQYNSVVTIWISCCIISCVEDI